VGSDHHYQTEMLDKGDEKPLSTIMAQITAEKSIAFRSAQITFQ
jgi:hypothetical protein